jgi:uncharacterized protein (TIGR00251 family)
MTIDLKMTAAGILLDVVVAPRASKERVLGAHDGSLKVALTAPPVDGAANAALAAFLAEGLGLPKSAVTLVRGRTSRRKTVLLAGVPVDAVRAFLESNGALARVQSG